MKTKKSKFIPFSARQGDVLITRVPFLPEKTTLSKVPRDKGRVILAYGETTGHAHALADKNCELFAPSSPGSTASYLEVQEAMASLEHDEHATIELAPGVYEITRQREYHPQAIRNVAD